ncbi:tetratricopeptide repeat protein [Jannaschia sp.]|nr:tetratricopeptide repeat protein [Jannaschia sp.]
MIRFPTLILMGLIAAPLPAFAIGDEDPVPPKPTPTATCPDGTAWDTKTAACVKLDAGLLDDDALYEIVRELAYAGRPAAASAALDAMSDPRDTRVLTYRGFLARKAGDMETAMRAYRAALVADPDNLLARSYMGQGLASAGRLAEAEDQLDEIRARGGAGSWAETALIEAVRTGVGFDY